MPSLKKFGKGAILLALAGSCAVNGLARKDQGMPRPEICEEETAQVTCLSRIPWDTIDDVMLGESHGDGLDDEYTIASLQFFREKGFTHLALEMDSREQENLDLYAAGMISRHKLVGMNERLAYSSHGQILLDMIDEALWLGYKVVAVSERDYADDPVNLSEREARAEENVRAVLQDDNDAKIVFFFGGAHLHEGEQYVYSFGSNLALLVVKLFDSSAPSPSWSSLKLGYRIQHNLGREVYTIGLADHPEMKKVRYDLAIDLSDWRDSEE